MNVLMKYWEVMMSKTLLKPLFSDVYGHQIDQQKFEDRLKMQKIIYFFQEAGQTVGEYDFAWYSHGPYSRLLQFDILDLKNVEDRKITYTQESAKVMNAIKNLMSKRMVYKDYEWAEVVASLMYLKRYVTPLDITYEDLVKEFEINRPELNNNEENMSALMAVCEYSREIGERTFFSD